MAVIKQGSTTLNAGSKGDKGERGEAGTGGGGVAIAVADLAELQAITSNQIASIQGNIDLATTTLNIPSGVTLRFEGGTIINGTLNGDDTYIWAEELLQIFDLTTVFAGSFNARAVYPEWFGGKGDGATENIEYFRKTIAFIDACGGGILELWGDVYNFSSQHSDGGWGVGYTGDGSEPIIEVHDNTQIVSYVKSKLAVVDAAYDEFIIHPIAVGGIDIPNKTLTLDDSGVNYQKSPQTGYKWYINNVYFGTQVSKLSPVYVFDDFAFTPNEGDLMTVQLEAIYKLLKFQSSKNSSIKGVHLVGNKKIIEAADKDGTLEGQNSIEFYGDCQFVTVDDCEISDIPSDAFNSSPDYNNSGSIVEFYEEGGIDSITGANDDSEIGSQVRSQTKYPLGSISTIVEEDRFMMFDQNSYQQWAGVPKGVLSIYYYTADDTYIDCRLRQNMYEYLPLLKDDLGNPADYLRLVIDATDTARQDLTGITGSSIVLDRLMTDEYDVFKNIFTDNSQLDNPTDFTITNDGVVSTIHFTVPLIASDEIKVIYTVYRVQAKAIEVPQYINITNNHIHNCGRQGISVTGMQDVLIDNNVCHDVNGSPGAFLDLEDGELLNRRIMISNNTVWNCKLGVLFYKTVDINVINNSFLRATDDRNSGGGNDLVFLQLAGQNKSAGAINIKNNYFVAGKCTVGDQMHFEGNTLVQSILTTVGGVCKNNIIDRGTFKIQSDADRTAGKMIIEGNVLNNAGLYNEGDLEPIQTPSYFINNKTINGDGTVYFRNGLEVDNLTMINSGKLFIYSGIANNITTDGDIELSHNPEDNGRVIYKGWKLKGVEPVITIGTSAAGSLDHFTFDGFEIETQSTNRNVLVCEKDLGSLTIKNSYIHTPNATGGDIINVGATTISKLKVLNSEVISTGGDLVSPVTDNANWYFKDSVFNTVDISTNTPLTTKINNIIE